MSKFMSHLALTLLIIAILTTYFLPTTTHAQTCKPSGTLIGKKVPRSKCDPNDDPCCKAGQPYKTYKCSPPVTGQTKAILTQNNFSEGGDGGGPSECDNKYHSNNTPVVALSTGWYKRGSRCGQEIIIHGNGRTTRAKVVDECDSTMGCDDEHAYQQPCRYNVVDASDAVWKALGVSPNNPKYGEMQITWSDA